MPHSFHSVSNFVGFALVKALPIGTSAPTVRSYTLSYTVLASRARVGARAEVTKNDLGKVLQRNIFSFFQSVSNFLGIELIRPWFLAVIHSDFLVWLTSATLRILSLTEHCHNQIN